MAEATIDRLQIQIEAEAAEGSKGLDRFIASMERLKNMVAGGIPGLSDIVAKFRDLNEAVNGLKGKSSTLSSFAKAINKLKDLNISTAANGISDFVREASALGTIGDSLQSVRDFGKGITSMTKSVQKLQGIDLDGVADKIKELVAALKPLTDEMIRAGSGMSNFGDQMKSLAQAMKSANSMKSQIAKQTQRSRSGTGGLNGLFNFAKIGAVIYGLERVGRAMKSAIMNAVDYEETINKVSVVMGKSAQEAAELADKMQALLGIDAGEFLNGTATFYSMATSMGITSKQSLVLSENLAQLAYDYASLHNKNPAEMMLKFRSALAREIEPVRALGKDISDLRLQQELYNLGIDKSITKMSQADKTILTYIALMRQSTSEMGDMARTIQSPANQLRILQAQFNLTARTIGSIFIPMLTAILPYAIAVIRVIGLLAGKLASFAGFEVPKIESPKFDIPDIGGDMSDSLDQIADSANKADKAVQHLIGGFDELNILPKKVESTADKIDGADGFGGILGGLDLPGYDPFENLVNSEVDKIVDDIMKKFDDILDIVVAIGAAIAAWKVATGLMKALEFIKSLSSKNLNFNIGFAALGALDFISDLKEFMKYFDDFKENGPTFHNVAGMISEFAGMVGDALIVLGNTKLGGALKVVQGIGEMVVAIEDISKNGVNWDNATTAIRSLSNIAIGIGAFTGNIKLAAWGIAIKGFNSIIGELGKNWDAIKQGDWSGVDKSVLIIGGLQILGGLVVALDVFSKLKGIAGIGKATQAVQTVSTATQTLDSTVNTSLSPSLSSLAKNLGLGLVIVAEVAAGALLLTGAIILLGKELEQVGLAWEPVIANGGTVAAAMGLGVGIMAGIGVATALLGSVGTPLIVNIALGTAILAELGIATGLFLIEIWAIGKGLDEIGKAWEPVLNNGETIATGIGLGTTLLVGIGVVTAALGVATVASAGTLPIAIGLGTAILVELAAAFVLFTKSLSDVADELSNNLYPSLNKLNEKLPTLSNNMGNFVKFMTEFADHVVSYTKVSAISGLSATIDTIIGWFTQDPIKKLAKDVNKIYEQTFDLNEKLKLAVPELKSASDLLKQYKTFLSEIESLTSTNVSLSNEMFVNMNEVGQKLVTGFVSGIKSKSTDYTNTAKDLTKGFIDNLTNGITSGKQTVINAFNRLTSELKSSANSAFSVSVMQTYGKNIATGISNGIAQGQSSAVNAMGRLGSGLKNELYNIISNLQRTASNNPIIIKVKTSRNGSYSGKYDNYDYYSASMERSISPFREQAASFRALSSAPTITPAAETFGATPATFSAEPAVYADGAYSESGIVGSYMQARSAQGGQSDSNLIAAIQQANMMLAEAEAQMADNVAERIINALVPALYDTKAPDKKQRGKEAVEYIREMTKRTGRNPVGA